MGWKINGQESKGGSVDGHGSWYTSEGVTGIQSSPTSEPVDGTNTPVGLEESPAETNPDSVQAETPDTQPLFPGTEAAPPAQL